MYLSYFIGYNNYLETNSRFSLVFLANVQPQGLVLNNFPFRQFLLYIPLFRKNMSYFAIS